MKSQRFDDRKESRVLAAMAFRPTVLSQVARIWKGSMFASEGANVIGKLCVDAWTRRSKAPGKAIEALTLDWSDGKDPELATQADRALAVVLGRPDKDMDSKLLLDLASDVFAEVAGRRAVQKAEAAFEAGQPKKGEELLQSYRRVELGESRTVDLFHDDAALLSALEDDRGDSIINYPKGTALAQFWGHALAKGNFVSFLAPEGRGKSWALVELAWLAHRQKNRVAYFVVGDLTQNQAIRRFAIRATKHPWRAGEMKIPSKFSIDKAGINIKFNTEKYDEGLTFAKAKEAVRKLVKSMSINASRFKFESHLAGQFSVSGIKARLADWRADGWSPDCVFIDYADLLAPPMGHKEARDKINATWMELRALSQESNCLLVTATQANRASYQANLVRDDMISEDKRKKGHVTAMIGLSCSDEEKKLGVWRFNMLKNRDEWFIPSSTVFVAGCLGIGRPCIKSAWKVDEKKDGGEEEDD